MPEGKSKSLLAFVLKDCTHSLLLSMGSVESESWFLISLILFLNLWSALCEDLIEFKLKFSLFLYLVVAQRYLNESGSIFNSLKVCIVYEFPSRQKVNGRHVPTCLLLFPQYMLHFELFHLHDEGICYQLLQYVYQIHYLNI